MKNDRTLRIIDVMQDKNMNATQFAEAIGIQRAAMSHIMLGRNNPSADVITKIIERFEDIDPGWLLTGKGQMKMMPELSANPDIHPLVAPVGREPGLFDQPISFDPQSNQNSETTGPVIKSHPDTPAEGHFQTERRVPDEKREGTEVNQMDNSIKITEKEVVIYKERPTKTIDKLLIFYSDNTYETFIPEKHDTK